MFDSPTLALGATTLYNTTADTIADVFLLKLENVTTGVAGLLSKNSTVAFYPNPFSSSTTIEINDFKNSFSVLYLFDIAGREVYKKQITNRKTEIQKGSLNSGMYLYKVVSGGNSIASGKIIIQ